MDSLNIYVTQYQPGESDGLAIEIPDEEMADFLNRFSQEVYDAKAIFGRKGWIITAVVTMLSGAIAYFVSGKALQPLKELSRQAEKINQMCIRDSGRRGRVCLHGGLPHHRLPHGVDPGRY